MWVIVLALCTGLAAADGGPSATSQSASPQQIERFSTGPVGAGTAPDTTGPRRTPTYAPPPPAVPSPPGGTDVKVNQDASNQSQNETSVAVNPLNPLNIVAACNDYRTGTVQTGHFASLDGGQTWVDGVFALKPGYAFSGDPTVTFDHLGNAYVLCMQYWSANGSAVYCYKSTNGGVTWDNGKQIDLDQANDKPMVSCDLSNGPYRGNLVVAWDRFGTPSGDHIYVSRSQDQGANWSTSQRINGSGSTTTIAPDVAIGANSVVYVMWADRGTFDIWVDRSFDGGASWGSDILVSAFSSIPSPLPGSYFRTFDIFSMDADWSAGPHSGNVYIAWHNWESPTPRHADIRFSRSTDQGATWSPSIKVNDDGLVRDQFFPWVVTDGHGNCNVVFYDRRDDPSDYLIHTYVARSSNGGTSFRTNKKVSDVSWDHQNDFGGGFIGDYIGMGASNQRVHPVWCDARNGGQDLYGDAVALNFYTDTGTISVATGGTAQFDVNMGPNLGSNDYWIFGSVSGTTPGLTFSNGVNLPLNWDAFLYYTIILANTPALQNTQGILDTTGSAVAYLNTGGPLDPSFAGITLWFAALVYNGIAALPLEATNPTAITLVP
ncbi:MAG: sialidase family protein [Planctomycetota bacterium]